MDTQLEKFDMNKVTEGLRARIQSELISFLPPEMWRNMIEKEVQDFINTREKVDSYGRKTGEQTSRLRLLVEAEIQNMVKPELKRWFEGTINSELSANSLRNDNTVAGVQMTEIVSDMAKQAAPEIVKFFMSQVLMSFMSHVRNNL